jgi:two-component system capsular synthesis response regulator RcsB
MPPKIRVVILEDHQSTIDGYLYRLRDQLQFEVVGSAHYGDDLEPLLAAQPVDMLLLDVSVPTAPDNRNPYPILHVIPRLLEKYTHLSVLVISMVAERPLIQAVVDAGANGYILKDDNEAIRELGSILLSVASGGFYLSKQVRQILLKRQPRDGTPRLTERQLEALSLCAAYPDQSLAYLAKKLSVANSTIRNLLSHTYIKLGVSHREAAVAKARQLGLITSTPLTVEHGADAEADSV